jgi:hypothetical protein
MNAGDTFIPAKPYDHLYMVISDPALDSEQVVMVNFTTHAPEEEQVCIAMPGEHPYLTVKSAVRYKDARIATVAQIEKLTQSGKLRPQHPLSLELLQRMRDGACQSEFLPEGCRKVLDDQGLI